MPRVDRPSTAPQPRSEPRPHPNWSLPLSALACAALLAGCSSGGGLFGRNKGPVDDNAPTLASLKARTADVQADTNDARLPTNEERTIAAYQAFLQQPPSTRPRPRCRRPSVKKPSAAWATWRWTAPTAAWPTAPRPTTARRSHATRPI